MELDSQEQIDEREAQFCADIVSECIQEAIFTNGAAMKTSDLYNNMNSITKDSMVLSSGRGNSTSSKVRNTARTVKGVNRLSSVMVVPEIGTSIIDLSLEAGQYCRAISKVKGC